MNAKALLSAPWRANLPGKAWLGLALLVLAVLGATAVGIFVHKPDRWLGCVIVVGFFLSFMWAGVMSNMVLLAIDARQLRLPALERGLIAVLWLYGLACVAVSTLLLGSFFGHFGTIAILMALFCAGGLSFALLPRFILVPFFLWPMALGALPFRFDLPDPTMAGFVRLGAPVLIVLALLAQWCWHRLVHGLNPYAVGWTRPMVLSFRHGGKTASWSPWVGVAGYARGGGDSARQMQCRPDWMQARAVLGNCGPARPVSGLRIALGGVFMPQTVLSGLRRIALIALPCLLYVALMELDHDRHHPVETWQSFWHDGAMLALIIVGAFGGMTLAMVSLTQLQQRWTRVSAELPLLALLPGLGRDVKRNLLDASLSPPLRQQTLLLVSLLALALSLHVGVQTALFVLLGQLGAAGFVVTFTLLIFGGCLPGRWPIAGVAVLDCVLICISLFAPSVSDPAAIMLGPLSLRTVLLAGWLVLALILFKLGRRGWRGLQQRPHPFLPS